MQDDECTICVDKVGMLFAEFVKPQNEIEVERAIIKEGNKQNIIFIHSQYSIFLTNFQNFLVCSKMDDPQECTELVKTYWAQVSKKIFTNDSAKLCCSSDGLGYCYTRYGKLKFLEYWFYN